MIVAMHSMFILLSALVVLCSPFPGSLFVPSAYAVDTSRPTISAFTIPATSLSSVVPVTITVSDNVKVTGYYLSTSSTKPLANAVGWTASKPAGYKFSGLTVGTPTTKTLYAWVKDAAGNVSLPKSDTVTIKPAPASLPRTGQTGCWNKAGSAIACTGTGQDGAIKAGVIWPSPRFTANSDQTMTDKLTGLVWSKNADPANDRKNWQQALNYIKSLNSKNYLGHNDWRLPNRSELASLVNQQQSNPATWLSSQGFTNVQADLYWSSSTIAGSTDYAWDVGMGDGFVSNGSKSRHDYYVWPVRGGQSGSLGYLALPRTGQTDCWNEYGDPIACTGTGQDGAIKAGVIWPSPRFTANSDQTMTDKLTGLIWSKNADSANGLKTWQEALDYIKSLNSSNHLGHNDWRLPNRNELESLVNKRKSNPAAWLNTQGFTNVQAYWYWSSSTHAGYTELACVVDMVDGFVNLNGKSDYYSYVWPVRGGQYGALGYSVISGAEGDAADIQAGDAIISEDAAGTSF